MSLDVHFVKMDTLRSAATGLLKPVYFTASLPSLISEWVGEQGVSRETLMSENTKLKAQELVLQHRIQQMVSLNTENHRLRALLNASERFDHQVVVAEIKGLDPDPYSHQVILNKGSQQGVFKGQPVLDANGLMGQVIQVSEKTSTVLLIADSSHAIPVEVNRNGVRAIAVGTGSLEKLQLIYVPDTANIEVGDVLITSGLAQRFPMGYPVATVTKISHDPGHAFATVEAKPAAALDRSHYVMLIFDRKKGEQ
jgi:rod shape-determining protein MreC